MNKNWKPNQNGSKRTTSRRHNDSNNHTDMLLATVAVIKNKNMFRDTPRTHPHIQHIVTRTSTAHRYTRTNTPKMLASDRRISKEQWAIYVPHAGERACGEVRATANKSRQQVAVSTLQSAPSSFGCIQSCFEHSALETRKRSRRNECVCV